MVQLARLTEPGRAVLAIGVLQRDFAVAKRKHVAAVHFDARPVGGTRAGERPLRDSPIALDKMQSVAPLGIRKRREDVRKGGAHGVPSSVARAADIRTRG